LTESTLGTSAISEPSKPSLRRVLSLWDLVLYGIVLIMPIAPVPLFGIVQKLSLGHAVTTILIAMVAMMLTAWIFYMAFEAYHTAVKRRAGEYVDEYSSLIDFRARGRFPVAGVALILLGIVLLLHTMGILDFYYVARYWPVLLILAGAWLLYNRFTGVDPAPKEVGHERQ